MRSIASRIVRGANVLLSTSAQQYVLTDLRTMIERPAKVDVAFTAYNSIQASAIWVQLRNNGQILDEKNTDATGQNLTAALSLQAECQPGTVEVWWKTSGGTINSGVAGPSGAQRSMSITEHG